ncbi:MAG: hypothetical protein A4E70_00565 [Syntrophus sp. PtaU1.Bin005]|nr:MAG: hypothetical protein A4E70_00565 [Syntrophus sp. PtaU1.Bin005]
MIGDVADDAGDSDHVASDNEGKFMGFIESFPYRLRGDHESPAANSPLITLPAGAGRLTGHEFEVGPAQDLLLPAAEESGIGGIDKEVTVLKVFQKEQILRGVDEEPQLLQRESQGVLFPLSQGGGLFKLPDPLLQGGDFLKKITARFRKFAHGLPAC